MTTPITFSSYLGWVNVADPANIPPDVRIISAEDLLRYEQFGDAARAAVNELITTTEDHESRIDAVESLNTTQGQTLTSQGQTITTQGQTIASHTQSIADLNGTVGTLTALSGKEVSASKAYDLTVVGGAKTLATVTGGSAYTSFELEVTLVGRNATGTLYVKALRYIRPENGNPQYLTVGADTLGGTITIAFTTSGTTGVNVTATVTANDAYITAHIRAKAGAGASSGAARTVTVAMA